MDEISNTNYYSQKSTLTLNLVIALHQAFVNHKPAPSRNLFPMFYNSLTSSFLSYKIAIHLWLWSYGFLQYFLPNKIKFLCELNKSFLNQTKEDSHNDDAQVHSVIYRCTSSMISPAALQWLRGNTGTVQGEGYPVYGRWLRIDLKYSSFWPGLAQQCGTVPRFTAVRVTRIPVRTSLTRSSTGLLVTVLAQCLRWGNPPDCRVFMVPVCCCIGMWIISEEGFLLPNMSKLLLLLKPQCFATYLCRVPGEIILPSGGLKGEHLWKKTILK